MSEALRPNSYHADVLQTIRFDDPITGGKFTAGIVLFNMHLEWPTCDWISLPQGVFLTLHLSAVVVCPCCGCFELRHDSVQVWCLPKCKTIHHTGWNMISLDSVLYVLKRLADSYLLHSRHRATLDFIRSYVSVHPKKKESGSLAAKCCSLFTSKSLTASVCCLLLSR